MILIADSGSTKCDWVLLSHSGDVIFKTQTPGINPNMLTTQMMHKRLAQSEEIAHVNQEVEQIYFYGSGCGTSKNRNRLKRFLEKYFRRAECEVHEDLLAACHAVTTEPGVVCILETGSNSCYFDGQHTQTNAPSLGYLIMDEASGHYFGQHLLSDYFYKRMPLNIAQKFKSKFDLYPHSIKHNLYKEKNPNAYLAKFANFMFSFSPVPEYFEDLISKGIQDFLDNRVLCYPEAKESPIHFVGSIAYFSKDIIAQVLDKNQLELGKVIQHPIDGLTAYFQKSLGQ